ncbi:MAG: ribonucleoside-diphosphate reductase subunit alpha [Verrucomicrobiaceae bacterium]|nr:MAG: ribonucleoside-diphosphate reductase subunit alpha [Verrucomicrobiaceae bacterium]
MIRHISLDEDIALKRLVTTPREQKPGFAWRDALDLDVSSHPEILVARSSGEEHAFNLADVADEIGAALTDLLLSREEKDIFNEENRGFVANVAHSVATRLLEQVRGGSGLKLSENDLSLLIEKALIENDAHDVAKSLVFKRSMRSASLTSGTEIPASAPVHVRLIRRNGSVVPWIEAKIETACRKAFLSTKENAEAAAGISQAVTERVRHRDQAFVHIEDVQDMVQEELMRQGYYKVAENYILYRAQRARSREDDASEPSEHQDSLIVVRQRDGQNVFWDGTELKRRIQFGMIGLDLNMDATQIERELRRSIGTEVTEDILKNTIILNARTLIERDADFAKFTARIMLSYIYEEVLDWKIMRDGIEGLRTAHRKAFKSYMRHGVSIERLSPKLLSYNFDTLADAIDPTADMDFDFLGIQTLYDRYLIVDKTKKQARRIETPQFFWMRVAMGLFLDEPSDREEWTIRLYNLYKSRRFCSSTPTLFNSGTLHSQLSSCYLYKVDDSIESIMQRGIADNAYLSKWAGGLGGSWTAVRGTGSYIKGTNGESQGVIPFLKLHNDQLVAVNQGGKRRGSGCAYLESWHNDVEDFLQLRRNTGDDRRRAHDLNTANWVPDLFMKRMEARENWTLFRSNEAPGLHDAYGKKFEELYLRYEQLAREGKIAGKEVPAIEMWKQMLKMLLETGHPWITFKDPCNLRSPQDHAGVIHSSNLCTEITLNTSEDETAVCNLGSVVLDTHMKADGSLDHEMLRETIQTAVRALDNVIDINFYPTEAARRSNLRHRPVGLGIMGLQNALFKRGLEFASDEAVEFNDEFMEAIAYYAYSASSDLAAERGSYSSYLGSKWDRGLLPQDTIDILEEERGIKIDVPRGGLMDWTPVREKIKTQGMRNSNVLAIAPTATISNIMGTTPCIEPNYKNLYAKENLGGKFTILSTELVRDLKKLGKWNDTMLEQIKYFEGELKNIDGIPEELVRKHLTVFGIPFQFVINAAARRQKWIDQSQSVNLFISEPDIKILSHMYRRAWHTGLKTTYYLRTLGASSIEGPTTNVKKELRGVVATAKKEFDAEEKLACSLEAMRNGGECEACQ